MTKVDSLKALVCKMTGKDISEVSGETVCDVLDQVVEAYEADTGGDAVTVESVEIVLPTKTVDGVGDVVMAYDAMMTFSVKLSNGKTVPATIDFVEV